MENVFEWTYFKTYDYAKQVRWIKIFLDVKKALFFCTRKMILQNVSTDWKEFFFSWVYTFFFKCAIYVVIHVILGFAFVS